MRIRLIAALSVASIFALACTDSPAPTAADAGLGARFAKGTGGACDAGVSRTAKAQLADLLAGANLKTAQDYWAAVESACDASNANAANSALFVYLNYLQGNYPFAGAKSSDPKALYALHINTVFGYVGYDSPGVTKALLDDGIVGVIPTTGGTREYIKAHLGAFKLAVQNATGDQRGHLFVMYLKTATDGCLSVDNLHEFGRCVELTAYPTVDPKFSPGIQVGMCADGLSGGAVSLGHETGGTTEVAGSLNYPSLAQCHPPEATGSWTGSPRDILTRLAWTGKRMFGVSTAYGTDRGIGGIGSLTSPFGALDAQIFAASFNVPPNVIGALPVLEDGNYTFDYEKTAQSSITVQNSLGNLTGPLVVLSQGGGNCNACGVLRFTAHFYSVSGTPADDGVYEITWTSVQASPSVKGAPFVVRDGSGNALATVGYRTLPSGNELTWNGSMVWTWTRNVAQTFKIVVDLNNDTTTLYIDGVSRGSGTIPAAANLATLGAEFTGIDSGVMGWDEIGVQRIADQPQP